MQYTINSRFHCKHTLPFLRGVSKIDDRLQHDGTDERRARMLLTTIESMLTTISDNIITAQDSPER